MDLNDIQKEVFQFMNERNYSPIPEFLEYSPAEMHNILFFPFHTESSIKILELTDEEYVKVPILNLIKFTIDLIEKNGEVKLTDKGFLPTKIVSEIYNQGFFKEENIEKGIVKLYKENDSISVRLTRILLELSGLVKKRKGKISLTQKSKDILNDNHKLLQLIMNTFSKKFNWAYFDGYGDNQIGQLGFGFTMILISNYGDEKQLTSLYASKYFNAFPQLKVLTIPEYDTIERFSTNCYSVRTFERFLYFFGVIKIENEQKGFIRETFIIKTDLFDKLIKCLPPRML
jgi:hypothetical protein